MRRPSVDDFCSLCHADCMETAPIAVDRPAPGVAVGTLNRPRAPNALAPAPRRRPTPGPRPPPGPDPGVRCPVFPGGGAPAFRPAYDPQGLPRLSADEV